MRTQEEIIKDIKKLEEELDSLVAQDVVVVRSSPSGCWMGKLEYKRGNEVKLSNARRLWFWGGAASLSQLAIDGVSKPKECKFPEAVPEVIVLEVCEILVASSRAIKSINEVLPWRQ